LRGRSYFLGNFESREYLSAVMRFRSFVWIGLGGLLGFLTIAAAYFLYPQPHQFSGTVFDPPVEAADFTLHARGGQTFRMSDQRGKVVLLFFGYTHCPDVCPLTMKDFHDVEQLLGDSAADVEFVMVTVDPDRDTPQVIGDYVANFSPDFVGLSGSENELDVAWKGYYIYREVARPAGDPTTGQDQAVNDPGGYLVDHTARVYVVDKTGYLRLSFPFALGAEAMAADVTQLVRE
jgi:protein SCO1